MEDAPKSRQVPANAGRTTRTSTARRLIERAAPQVKRHRSKVMFATAHEAVDQEVNGGFVSMGLEPGERRANNLFGIAAEFNDKGRQESEGMATESAENPSDAKLVDFRPGNETAEIAAMPSQAASLMAKLAMRGFRQTIFFFGQAILLDYRPDRCGHFLQVLMSQENLKDFKLSC